MSAEEVGDDQEVSGLAGERTDLAWSRSGLAVLVCSAALVKRIVPELSTLDARAIVVVALVIGAIAWVSAVIWGRVVAATPLTGRAIADARTIRAVALITTALGVAATVVAVLPAR